MRARLTLLAIILIGAAVYSGTQYVHRTAADTMAASPVITPRPRSGSMNFGIAAGSGLTTDSPAVLIQRLNTMQNLGVGWVRFDFDWSNIQPTNATAYNWTATDRVVQAALSHHLKILGTIDYTPMWARSAGCTTTHCQPANPAVFGAFSGAVAAHYAPMGLHEWEVWNEENTVNFWQPAPDPQAYAQVLKASYVAIKKADVTAFVLSGGLARTTNAQGNITPASYLKELYSLGAQGSFDAIASHPYAYPALPTANDPNGPFALHQIMTNYGDSAQQVWVTEIGAPTGGPSGQYVSESAQANTIIAAAKIYNQPWMGPLFWYSDIDAGTSPATKENFFGLMGVNDTHKSAYNSLQQIISGSR